MFYQEGYSLGTPSVLPWRLTRMSTIQTLQTSVDALLAEIERASTEPDAQHRKLEYAAEGLRQLKEELAAQNPDINAIRRHSTSLYRFVTDSLSFEASAIGKKLNDLSTELLELQG
jgi:chromosome segregation ATPase